jgi:hypothetical protein
MAVLFRRSLLETCTAVHCAGLGLGARRKAPILLLMAIIVYRTVLCAKYQCVVDVSAGPYYVRSITTRLGVPEFSDPLDPTLFVFRIISWSRLRWYI